LQAYLRGAGILEVLQADVVASAGLEGNGAGVDDGGMDGPVIDQQFAVDPEADTVIADGAECVGLGVLRFNLADPANAEGFRLNGRCGGGGAPGVVNGFDAFERQACEVGVVEVLP